MTHERRLCQGVLAKVDCIDDANKDLCNDQEVRGFPTVKLFRNDGSDAVDYDGGRTADDIVAYMKKCVLHPAPSRGLPCAC